MTECLSVNCKAELAGNTAPSIHVYNLKDPAPPGPGERETHSCEVWQGQFWCSCSACRPRADDETPATPAEQYQVLLKEFQAASSSGRALTDEERLKFVGDVY